MTRADVSLSGLLSIFTPDGTYSAFGDTYPLSAFPGLVEAAPKGLYLTGTPAISFTGDDTADGWRIKTRSMTFTRRSGAHDHGKPHAHPRLSSEFLS
ncbi:MAG TPA: hypothetical protein VGG75_33600 [Trebonia sp.]|jgi:hypothetical protein